MEKTRSSASGEFWAFALTRIRHLIPISPSYQTTIARTNVQQDIRAAWIDFRSEEWKGATVFATTAVEALLFWALKRRPDVQESERLDKQHLGDYINEAERLGVIAR